MSILFVFLITLLNLGISYWNGMAVGKAWVESKSIGGWVRLLVWAGAIQSALGFTWSFMTIIGLALGATGVLTLRDLEAFFSLGYLIVIPGILMSGIVIWLDSIAHAFRTRKWGDIGVAGWNTFAQAYNTYHAIEGIGPAFENVLDFFKGDGDSSDGDSAKAMLVVLIVILCLGAGIITTWVIINHYAAQEPLPEIRRGYR